MKGTKWLALLAAAILSACAQSAPAQQTINDAAAALGGRDRILAVKTLVIEGTGTNGNLGRAIRPPAPLQPFNLPGTNPPITGAAARTAPRRTGRPTPHTFQGRVPGSQGCG